MKDTIPHITMKELEEITYRALLRSHGKCDKRLKDKTIVEGKIKKIIYFKERKI